MPYLLWAKKSKVANHFTANPELCLCAKFLAFVPKIYIKKNPEPYELIFKNTQSSGEESVQKGSRKINLPYHHPIETVRVFSRAPLENTRLVLNSVASLHVSYKGLKNGMHLYEISFHGTINFSRIDAPYFHFEATEDTAIYHFGIGFNIARFMSGMGGMAFSK